ncbi:hypothetical protein MTR67_003337 [Solanum verrucosum]|uniref:Uncharacterized protein n=1 Tax=Solanum verrucosum TaxID=315347 RepID=A0AAF0T6S7_SOLVR|nr:hypothetical protein MTR67_003337 [Solanum verrucosum]
MRFGLGTTNGSRVLALSKV